MDTDTDIEHLKGIQGTWKRKRLIPCSFRLEGQYRPTIKQCTVPGRLEMGDAHTEATTETS